MSCRTGPLRVGRPLRGMCTGRGGMRFLGPRDARVKSHDSDQRPGRCGSLHLDKLKRRANARPPRRRPVRQDALEAQRADVGGVRRERHGFEVHGAHAVVGTEDGAEKAAAQMELHRVLLDGEMLRLAGEIAEDDEDWIGCGDVLWFADHDEDVLIVTVDGEVFAGVEGGVAVMQLGEPAIPVEE